MENQDNTQAVETVNEPEVKVMGQAADTTSAIRQKVEEARKRRAATEDEQGDMPVDDRLSLPKRIMDKYRAEQIHLTWINDLPGNIANFEDRGYFKVEELGIDTRRHAGVNASGEPYVTVLMGIPLDIFDKDRAREQKERDELMEQMRTGDKTNDTANSKDTGSFYASKDNVLGQKQ